MPGNGIKWPTLHRVLTPRPPRGYLELLLREPELAQVGEPHELEESPWFWNKIHDVHAEVNQSIKFEYDPPGDDRWGMFRQEMHRGLSGLGSMLYGDCDDYAVEKLRRFLYWEYFKRSALLLSLCKVGGNEYHLTLNLVTNKGQVVLDNRQPGVWRIGRMQGYEWRAQETPGSSRWRLMSNRSV